MISCVIRRICNKTVWYLYSHDSIATTWTRRFHQAREFADEEVATRFINESLTPKQRSECDTFSEHETWSI